jgi:hypothetical protein
MVSHWFDQCDLNSRHLGQTFAARVSTTPSGALMKAWQQMQARLAAEQAPLSRGKNGTDVGNGR